PHPVPHRGAPAVGRRQRDRHRDRLRARVRARFALARARRRPARVGDRGGRAGGGRRRRGVRRGPGEPRRAPRSRAGPGEAVTMRRADLIALAFGSVRSAPLRTALTALGIAIGIFAAVVLTALGSGLREFVLAEFAAFGSNHLTVQPGLAQTHGVPGGLVHNTRPLTVADAQAIATVAGVRYVSPQVAGDAAAKYGVRTLRVTVFGCSSSVPDMYHMAVALGSFLPNDP